MGTFYTNIHVKTDEQSPVIAAIKPCGAEPAYVSKSKNGWVSVFPHATEEQDEAEMLRICKSISKELNTGAIGFTVHDSDIFTYVLAEKGEIVDEYNSWPGYFDGGNDTPEGGNADTLMKYAGPGITREKLHDILHGKSSQKSGDAEDFDIAMNQARGESGLKLVKSTINKAVPWFLKPLAWVAITIFFALNKKKLAEATMKSPLITVEGFSVFSGDEKAAQVATALIIDHSCATSGFKYISERDSPVSGARLVGKAIRMED